MHWVHWIRSIAGRGIIRPALGVLALGMLVASAARAADDCRQALVLGLDVSLSVNRFDFALQRDGLAQALTDDAVMQALLASPRRPVEMAVFEWSGQFNQTLLVNWTRIDSAARLQSIANTLRTRPQGLRSGRTGLGAAMLYARDLLRQRPNCAIWTLDISGDGASNNGIAPERVQPHLQIENIGVNALVIERRWAHVAPDAPPLSQYFQHSVIVGPDAFVETIFDFDSYAAAIRRKLLRELEPVVGQGPPPNGKARRLADLR